MAKKQTNKQKGYEWEQEFAEYMKEELGYNECIMNYTVKGKTNTNEYEIDIVGKTLSETGKLFRTVGYGLIIFGIGFISFWFLDIIELYEDEILILGVLIILGGIAMEMGKNNMYDYTWVECKNHSIPISKTVLNDLQAKIKDYANLKENKHEFKRIIVSSKNGFAKNVIHFAQDYNIELYEKIDKKIVKTELTTM